MTLARNETRIERNETRLERNETRLERNETRLARNETRGGNLHLGGTVGDYAGTNDIWPSAYVTGPRSKTFHNVLLSTKY